MIDILIVSPAPTSSLKGNGVTARRWQGALQSLGHRVRVDREYDHQPCDLLLALHARRSAASVQRFHALHPDRPLLLALTGTDLYDDLGHDADAQRSVELATHLITLQPALPDDFPPHLRPRVHVVYQSTTVPDDIPAPSGEEFAVCVFGHLREVKDPFRAAEASRDLPADSRIRIHQAGAALAPGFAEFATAEMRTNPRYTWRRELPRDDALRLLGSSHLHVLSSRMEGGANALVEAITLGVPSLCSRISGAIGILGEDYPGYFPYGDTGALRAAMLRAEREPAFVASLRAHGEAARPLLTPEREVESWRRLLKKVLEPAEASEP